MIAFKVIAAIGPNNELGHDGELIYRSGVDLDHFVQYTQAAGAVVMGRKTWESLPVRSRPLRYRHTFLLTRRADYDPGVSAASATVCTSMAAVTTAMETRGYRQAAVAGGAEIYRMFLPFATELSLSVFEASAPASVYWPAELVTEDWKLVDVRTPLSDPPFQIRTYRR